MDPASKSSSAFPITPDDLLAASCGMAVGTGIGIAIGLANAGPLLLPTALGMVGLVGGAVIGRSSRRRKGSEGHSNSA